jgi:hypothetical protein
MCLGPMTRLNSYRIAAIHKYACYRDLVPPTTTVALIVQKTGATESGFNTWTQRFLPKVSVWLPANFGGILVLQPYDLGRTNSAIEYSGPRTLSEKSAWDCRQCLLLQGLGTGKLCVRGGLKQPDTLLHKQVYFTATENTCEIVLCLNSSRCYVGKLVRVLVVTMSHIAMLRTSGNLEVSLGRKLVRLHVEKPRCDSLLHIRNLSGLLK